MAAWRWFKKGWNLNAGRHLPRTNEGKPRPQKVTLTLDILEDRLAPAVQAVSLADPTLFVDTGAGASITSPLPASSISANGRFVAFVSEAVNLAAGQKDINAVKDVFLHDRQTGVTTLVSHKAGDLLQVANAISDTPVISADGAFVVFTSSATDLISGIDTNNATDVFLFERATGNITLVSHTFADLTATPNGTSTAAVISNDGAFVAFTSSAFNLVNGTDNNPSTDVFLYERATGAVSLVSHVPGSNTTFDTGTSRLPVISGNGAFVAFVSSSGNLVNGGSDTNGRDDVFLYHRSNATIQLVSHVAGNNTAASTNIAGFGEIDAPSISSDGAFLTFNSLAPDLVAGTDTNTATDVFLYEQATQTVSLVSHIPNNATTAGNNASRAATLSKDGTSIAFTTRATDLEAGNYGFPGWSNVFLYQRSNGSLNLLTRDIDPINPLTAADGESSAPLISDNGRYVAFDSLATNLASGDTNSTSDVFVFDRDQNVVTLVSRSTASGNPSGNGRSMNPVMSGDGSAIAFTTDATNLVTNLRDGNGATDVILFDQTTSARSALSRHDPSMPSVTGNGPSATSPLPPSSVSADGRFAVFVSLASNLVPGQNDLNDATFRNDVFLYDRQTGQVTLVSHAFGNNSTTGNGGSDSPVISANGAFIAFRSSSTNLLSGAAGAPGPNTNIYLFNRATGTISLVSHAGGSLPFTNFAGSPTISADGAFVVFVCLANLGGANDPNFGFDVYLYERATTNLTLVSHAFNDNSTPANGFSEAPVISGDAAYIAFRSRATNLVNGTDNNNLDDVFLFERANGSVTLISHVPGNPTTTGNEASDSPVINANGAFIAFTSSATDLVGGTDTNTGKDVFLFNRATGAVALVSHVQGNNTTAGTNPFGGAVSDGPAISGNGAWVAFTSTASDLTGGTESNLSAADVFLYEQSTGNVSLVSHGQGLPTTTGNGASDLATISNDGAFIAFRSKASNLFNGTDNNSSEDVFLFEKATGLITLSSQATGGPTTPGNNSSGSPVISGDGTTVYFTSNASDLITNDFNSSADVFLLFQSSDTTAPKVVDVTSSTLNGTYKIGDAISIQITFDEAVIVNTSLGTPKLALNSGGNAQYVSGNNSNALTFRYVVSSGENAADLDYGSTSALSLNGGVIRDTAGNNANISLPPTGGPGSLGANKDLVIEAISPRVTNINSSTANGTYRVGESISIEVQFDDLVTVDTSGGTPRLALNSGGTATFVSGSGTNTLIFNYEIVLGHRSADLDYASTTALALNGASIRDETGNNANLLLPNPGATSSLGANKDLVITTANVTSSSANGTYFAGDTISIQVDLGETVTVDTTGGTPTLALNTGGNASYSTGSGTSVLTFVYTVASGQQTFDLEYASSSALNLNGGIIRDGNGNAMNVTLPIPGATGSLGTNKNLVIDAVPHPIVTSITPSTVITDNYLFRYRFRNFDLVIRYDQEMDTLIKPVVSFPVENPAATLTFQSGSWSTDKKTYVAFYRAVDANQELANIDVRVDGAKSLTGISQVPKVAVDLFSIDTISPTILNIIPNLNPINDSTNGNGVFTLTATFSENIDQRFIPTLGFVYPAFNSPWRTLSLQSSVMTNPNTCVYTFNVVDGNQHLPNIRVFLGRFQDLAGNFKYREDVFDVFTIDNRSPKVSRITPSVNTISHAEVGSAMFSLKVAFDAPMGPTVKPTISFPLEDPSATLSFSSGNWIDPKTYLALYDVVDVNQFLSRVDVSVTGGKSANGNNQVQGNLFNVFNIDTGSPVVLSITTSVPNIGAAHIGNTFSLAVQFDQNMDPNFAPTLLFPRENPWGTLRLELGLWTDPTTYVATFRVSDGNRLLTKVDVKVQGARNEVGRLQLPRTIVDLFNIDTQDPRATFVTGAQPFVNENTGPIYGILVSYNEVMDTNFHPSLTFPGKDVSATLTPRPGSWVNPTTYQAQFDVADTNQVLSHIPVMVSGGKDQWGNPQVERTFFNVFSIDTVGPQLLSVNASSVTLTNSSVGRSRFRLSFDFDKYMSVNFLPLVTFPVENPSATLVFRQSYWARPTVKTFYVLFDVVNAKQNLTSIDVRITAAMDRAGNTITRDIPDVFNIAMQ
jgi:Tol biopolymer transport system component